VFRAQLTNASDRRRPSHFEVFVFRRPTIEPPWLKLNRRVQHSPCLSCVLPFSGPSTEIGVSSACSRRHVIRDTSESSLSAHRLTAAVGYGTCQPVDPVSIEDRQDGTCKGRFLSLLWKVFTVFRDERVCQQTGGQNALLPMTICKHRRSGQGATAVHHSPST
jgi:hypothetical protein